MDLRAAGGIAPMEVGMEVAPMQKSGSLEFEVEQQFDLEEGMGSMAHASLNGNGGGSVPSMSGSGNGSGGGRGGAVPARRAPPRSGDSLDGAVPAPAGLNFFEDVTPPAGADVDWSTGLVEEPASNASDFSTGTQLTNEEDDL